MQLLEALKDVAEDNLEKVMGVSKKFKDFMDFDDDDDDQLDKVAEQLTATQSVKKEFVEFTDALINLISEKFNIPVIDEKMSDVIEKAAGRILIKVIAGLLKEKIAQGEIDQEVA